MIKVDNEFLELNKNLVFSIVNKYASNYNKEDLYQVGMMAVIRASEMYDNERNVKFSTFAYKYILGEILKYIREDKGVKLSRDIIKLYKKIISLKNQMYLTCGRYITDEEVSELLNVSISKINEVMKLCSGVESLDSVISSDDKDLTLMDTIKDENNLSKEDLISLKDALRNLNKEDQMLIYQRYYEGKSQTEIAKEKNISQVKVYRLERKILDDLSDKLCA